MELAPIDWEDKPGLFESALRHKSLLAGLIVLGALLGLGLSLLQPTLYEGESRVLLAVPGGDSGIEPNRYLLDQTELIGSVTVTDRAAGLVHGRVSGETLRERMTTENTIDRDLVTIKVLDTTAEGARELADAVGRAYEQLLDDRDESAANELNSRWNRLRHSVVRAHQQLRANPGDPVLRAERDALTAQLGQLAIRRQQLTVGDDQTAGGVQLRETLPAAGRPAQPGTERNVAAGALLGLFAASGLAWWLNGRSETRVQASGEAERLLGLPLLARLPVPTRKRGARARPVMLDDPETVEAEAFRFLRTSFAAAARQSNARVIMVTSATEQEGKSIVAANLALALARAGTRVALVDLDLRRPAQGRMLELPESFGFTEVALGRVRLERALHRLVLVNNERAPGGRNGQDGGQQRREAGFVEVLPTGARPKGVGEFVGNQSTEDVIRRLRDRVDLVLVDAPPMLRVGDALSLATIVDALLIVTRLNVVRRKSLSELRRLLDTVATRPLGVVINGAPPTDTYTRPYGMPTRPSSAVTRGAGGTSSREGSQVDQQAGRAGQ
jgi:succinoglycan biosynthesis transport protein ExoP